MPAPLHRLIAVLCLAGSACQSLPDQPYPWPGTVSIGVLPRDKYDWATTMHAYSMPDPDGFGTWWQLSLDPVELLYTLYGGVPDDSHRGDEREDHIVGDFSFSRDAASFGFGTGVAKNLGDRIMVFSGVGWAMAFEHSYSRDRRGAYDYREEEHLHYLTSGLNLIGGVQYRITPDIGLEMGYQSFYETWYIGVAFPF